MKKLLITVLSASIFFGKAQAQISDGDAKLLYQQAEDAYNIITVYVERHTITQN